MTEYEIKNIIFEREAKIYRIELGLRKQIEEQLENHLVRLRIRNTLDPVIMKFRIPAISLPHQLRMCVPVSGGD